MEHLASVSNGPGGATRRVFVPRAEWRRRADARRHAAPAIAPRAPVADQLRDDEMLQNEAVLPCQFSEQMRAGAALRPATQLMLAVLEDALGTFQKHAASSTQRGRALFAGAEEWFAGASAPLSFATVCEALELDAGYVRGGLRRWHARRQERATSTAKVARLPRRLATSDAA
jgi:hypothetical protein